MLLIHTYNFRDSYRLSERQGTIMPAAKKAEWLPSPCLIMTGSGGYLEPGAFCVLERSDKTVYIAETAACPKDRRLFCAQLCTMRRQEV